MPVMGATRARTSLASAAFASAILVALAPALADAPTVGNPQYDAFDSSNIWIRDRHTELRWQRYVDTKLVVQPEAEAGCAALTLDGRKWRLPSVKELLTIVDEDVHAEYENGAPAEKAIDSHAFLGTPSQCFWTTPIVAGNIAWTVSFRNGDANAYDATGQGCSFRCVER
jgi:hypothetical protein